MLFRFLKYLQPTHYFQVCKKNGTSIFPIVDNLPEEILQQLSLDLHYKSEKAQAYDLSWQAVQKGYIGTTETHSTFEKLPLEDDYRFVRKNFHNIWSLYVLLIRLVTFKNPINELLGYLKARPVQREHFYENVIQYTAFDTFKSQLIINKPLVSVIIPTLNRYTYLKDVLKDLELQTYKHFEVIVVDQSDAFRPDFYKGWNLTLNYWFQEEKALWKARNDAIKSAKGDYILMSEDDIRFQNDYIEQHLKTLDFFKADVSCGVFFPEGSTIPKGRNYFKLAEQFATGNALLKIDLFKAVGLYDRQFEKQRMGDAEFGLRLLINGFQLISNPLAYCIDVKASEGGLRIDGGSWDAWRPKKLFAPRPVPSVLYLSRTYFGTKRSILMVLVHIIPSIVPYKFKKNKVLKALSFLLLPFFLPVILFLVLKSWKLSSEKLKEGAKIELYV